MLAYYGTQLSPHMDKTPEGYLICRDVPIARTGTQEYLAGELQLEGDPERVVKVNRYPEDVFEPAALASFEGKDVTQGHPSENVGPENFSSYTKGHVQNVRRAGEHIIADLIIKDANLVSDVWNGVTREVSCGYLCTYVPDGDGYKQQNIRGNHVAVVPRGRAGAAVSIKDQAASEAGKGKKRMKKETKGGTAGVTTFNGRSGRVLPASGDYTAAMVGAIPASAVQDIQAITQADYDALTTKSPSTLYLIKE